MEKISKNTLVTISLQLHSKDGELLDDSEKLMYLHGGYGQIFQKLEDELGAKQRGDTFSILLSPIDAFGEFNQSLLIKESLKELPEDIELGLELEGEDASIVWIVEEIKDGFATLNANHELAGIPLRVSGEILELQQLSDQGVQEILNMEHKH